MTLSELNKLTQQFIVLQIAATEVFCSIKHELYEIEKKELSAKLTEQNRQKRRALEKQMDKQLKVFRQREQNYLKYNNELIDRFERSNDDLSRQLYEDRVGELMDALNDILKVS